MHFQNFSIPLSSFPLSPSPIPVYHPMSLVLRLCSLSPIFCSLSHVSDPIVSRLLYYVSRDLSPISHSPFSVP
jgi:hypothetical protein